MAVDLACPNCGRGPYRVCNGLGACAACGYVGKVEPGQLRSPGEPAAWLAVAYGGKVRKRKKRGRS